MQNHQENQCYISNFLFFLGSSNFYFKNVTPLSSALTILNSTIIYLPTSRGQGRREPGLFLFQFSRDLTWRLSTRRVHGISKIIYWWWIESRLAKLWRIYPFFMQIFGCKSLIFLYVLCQRVQVGLQQTTLVSLQNMTRMMILVFGGPT